MPKKSFKCSKCPRSFSMAAHLARHMNSTHASPQKKGAAKRKRKAKRRGKVTKAKRVMARRAGRPKGVSARTGLRGMSLDQLMELIAAARVEAGRKIAVIKKSLK